MKFECSRHSYGPPKGHYQEMRECLFVPGIPAQILSPNGPPVAAVICEQMSKEVVLNTSIVDGKARRRLDVSRTFRKIILKEETWNTMTVALASPGAQTHSGKNLDNYEELHGYVSQWIIQNNKGCAPGGTNVHSCFCECSTLNQVVAPAGRELRGGKNQGKQAL